MSNAVFVWIDYDAKEESETTSAHFVGQRADKSAKDHGRGKSGDKELSDGEFRESVILVKSVHVGTLQPIRGHHNLDTKEEPRGGRGRREQESEKKKERRCEKEREKQKKKKEKREKMKEKKKEKRRKRKESAKERKQPTTTTTRLNKR